MLRQLGLLYDVSSSMEAPFNIVQRNGSSESKSNYLIHLMNKLIKEKNTHVFTLLFGGKKEAQIIDFISYIEKMDIYLSKLDLTKENQKEEFNKSIKEIYPNVINNFDEVEDLTNLNMAFITGLIREDNHNYANKDMIIHISTIIEGIIFFLEDLILKKRKIIKEENNLQEVINIAIEKLFNKIYEQMKYDDNIKIIESDKLKPILEKMDELINKCIPHFPPNENRNLIYYLKDKIYGESHLVEACKKALKLFSVNKHKYHQQMLIIITDGSSDDIDKLKDIINQLKKNNVYVLICYISNYCSNYMLYNKIEYTNIKEESDKKLFELSSQIQLGDPIFKCFLSNSRVINPKILGFLLE